MAPLASPYSTPEDLAIDESQLMLGQKFDKAKVVETCAREIDAKLGFMYQLPLTPIAPATELPKYQVDLLFTINNNMATGRILQGMKGSGDSNTQHAWGKALCDSADNMLNMIANGDVELDAVRVVDGPTSLDSQRGPKAVVYDDSSMVTAFEEQVFRNRPVQVYPGGPF